MFFSKTILSSGISALILSGCSSNTVGDQLTAQGEGPAGALGKEWNRANEMVKDGRKKVKKGEDLVSEGEKMVKRGERLKAETELAATRAGYLKTSR